MSNDAVGHNRRWHLLLMVTPAHGKPCGQAPGQENLERGVGTHYCHSGLSMEMFFDASRFLIIHVNLRSHSELRPKRKGGFSVSHSEMFLR